MKKHYASAEEARASVTGFLFVWEVDAALRLGREAIKFSYEDAELVDRIPPPPGTIELHASSGALVMFGGEVTVRVTRSTYPEPPSGMKFTPNLETLWLRYQGYQAQREPISAMAYFCLTVVEKSAGGRSEAAEKYNINFDVLRKIGELTASRGDVATARKMHANLVPHTPQELAWIEAAIQIIIRRVAEIEAASASTTITMKDLPKL